MPDSDDREVTQPPTVPTLVWADVPIDDIQQRYKSGDLVLEDLREILAEERELPLRPPGVHSRSREDGTPWQRGYLVPWLEKQVEGGVKVQYEHLTALAPIVAAYSHKWADFDVGRNGSSRTGKQISATVKELIQCDPLPEPDLLKSAYAWWHATKKGIAIPKASVAVADMYREYVTWKQERDGPWPCPDCGRAQTNGKGRLCDGCYAEQAALLETPSLDAPAPVELPAAWAASLAQILPGGRMPVGEVFVATMGQLELQLDRATFENWLKGAKAVRYTDGVLFVNVRHAYVRDWLNKHLLSLFEHTLRDIAGEPLVVRFMSDGEIAALVAAEAVKVTNEEVAV